MSDDSTIDVAGLTKRYGHTVGIQELDLEIHAGEVFGFLGPNGAGKTTTIRCLVGLLNPTTGRVRVLGLDPLGDHKQLAPKIGYLPGELRLYGELSGARHLQLLGDLQGGPTPRRAELCERLALSARDLDRPIQTYSHGMKQKVGLIQAFQHDPEVLILDEPTEGLDPLVQETFFELLTEARSAGRTIFLSSHVLSEVQRACGRVAIVRAGHVVAVEAVEALRSSRLRQVRLTFPAGDDHRLIRPEARWAPEWAGDQLRLVIDPDELVSALRGLLALPVIDVAVEEAGLDEVFLDYYRPTRPQPQAQAAS